MHSLDEDIGKHGPVYRDRARFIIAPSANLRRHRSSQANVYRFRPISVLRRLSAVLLTKSPPSTIA
jgi:hypothetical protein